MERKRILVAYFSRRGNNIVNGTIVNLPVGNTEALAQMIRKMTKCDIFRIETVKPYPLDYEETTEVARKELREKARPKLSNRVENMDLYGVILLGIRIAGEQFLCLLQRSCQSTISQGKLLFPSAPTKEADLGEALMTSKNFALTQQFLMVLRCVAAA